ncbi:hypothetical protein BDB00DRAFT_837438, partial [Zychaea mexicana]|uniref:uncharacterized protein n=1 Tax=Zychaea mexicana TaxID=64656 RepID=UPI0022FF35BC
MPSPPKPWETGGTTAASTTTSATSALSGGAPASSITTDLTSSVNSPAVPNRPSAMASTTGYGGG